MKLKSLMASLLLALSCEILNAVTLTPLPLPTLTDDLRTWTDGSAYAPLFPASSQTFAGVPFDFQSDANNNTIFYGGTLGAPADADLHIPVNIAGVTTAYTLINTAFGTDGSSVGMITFVGTGGLLHQVDLIAGVNVRDHFYGSFINTTTDPSTTQGVFGLNAPGSAHFDMQTFDLPAGFASETLTEIIFSSRGIGNPDGKAFLAAATVSSISTVPESASTLLLLALGCGLLRACLRNRA